MQTLSEENYLKAIWKLIGVSGGTVNTNAIAASVNTRAASVTDMLKKLSDKHLIDYVPYKGNARVPFSIKYFLVAILFVLFDVEVIFLYPWAVNFRGKDGLGIIGFVEMVSFMLVFLVGFYYILRKGALKWEE